MNLILERCSNCGAMVDAEDLFCANCGTEVPDRQARPSARVALEAKNFHCRGCGASMNYDASARALKCPFCGSVDLEDDKSQGLLAPECVIPFAVDRVQAQDYLRRWLGSSFWHPNDLRTSAELTELRAVFVPFWVVSTRVETHWTADTGRPPPGARADWYPLSGQAERQYDGVWVPASSGLDVAEIEPVAPFDIGAAVPPDRVDLVDVTVEQFTVSRRYARPLAQGRLEAAEAAAVAQEVGGRTRNIHVNVLMADATSRAALAPMYVLAYRYRDKVYRFVVNGQTGRATGTAPVSWPKILRVIGMVVLILAVLAVALAH